MLLGIGRLDDFVVVDPQDWEILEEEESLGHSV